MSAAVETALSKIEIPDDEPEKWSVLFDAAILLRASNALKVVRLLCEQAHWEFAVAAVRQLFELVINMEYLAAQPDRTKSIFHYAKYGLLQVVRHDYEDLLYDKKTGRPVDASRLAILESMLEHTFPEFRSVGTTGQVRWAHSWSGRSARFLAEQSGHPLREDQYRLLFSAWSEQTHASPATLLDNMFGHGLPIDKVVASDETRIAETVTNALTFFLELWTLLPHAPVVDYVKYLEWTNTVIAEAQKHGAPTPASGLSDGPT